MLITNNNYAANADYVFAETVDHRRFSKLNDKSIFISEKNAVSVTYKSTMLRISDGDSIFCRTDYIDELFYLIKKTKKINLKLITHQTDTNISSKLEQKLPKNFSFWYAINKDTDSQKVISIPIGLAGDFADKNLHIKNFNEKKIKKFDLKSKERKIYINFQKNTNNIERGLAINTLKKSERVVISEPNLSKSKYKKDLEKFAFVLCPWGNGYDTHRIWETLYAGSIPIVKPHNTFEYLENLPALFINDYEDLLNYDLDNFIDQFKIDDFNLEKLFIEYWTSFIKNENTNNQKVSIPIRYSVTLFFHLKLKIQNKFNSYRKKLFYNLRRVKFKIINLNKN